MLRLLFTRGVCYNVNTRLNHEYVKKRVLHVTFGITNDTYLLYRQGAVNVRCICYLITVTIKDISPTCWELLINNVLGLVVFPDREVTVPCVNLGKVRF